MSEILQQLTIDQGISTLLSFVWIIIIVLVIKNAPGLVKQLIKAWSDMTDALEKQNEVTEANSNFIIESMETHKRLDADILHAAEERKQVTQTIKQLTAAVSELKEKVEDAATKEDVQRIEEQIATLNELLEQTLPFLLEGQSENVEK